MYTQCPAIVLFNFSPIFVKESIYFDPPPRDIYISSRERMKGRKEKRQEMKKINGKKGKCFYLYIVQAEFDGGRLVGRRRRTLGVEGERTDAAGRRRTDQLPGARLRRLLRYLAV